MNKRQKGTEWEKLAAAYLEENGMQIKEANFRCRQGEIDLVGYHLGCLVFVEVKYRSSNRLGNALEAVDYRKQKKICRVADYYRYIHKIGSNVSIRYDVVAIQNGEISWVQNAFMHIY